MRSLRWLLFSLVACGPASPPRAAARFAGELAAPARDRASATWTTGDGRSVPLRTVRVRAEIHGPVAITDVTYGFVDPEPRASEGEGEVAVALPRGASVAGVVLEDGSSSKRSDVDVKAFAHEKEGVTARFPAARSQHRDVSVVYVETLATAFTPYRVLLAGLPTLAQLDVRVRIPSLGQEYVRSGAGEAPAHDFVVMPPRELGAAARSERFAVVRVETAPPVRDGLPELGDVAVLVDSSASHTSEYAGAVARAERLLARVKARSVRVAAFDQEVVPLATLHDAAARRPAGGTDLAAALGWAGGADRTIVVTDGALEPPATTSARIDVVVSRAADAAGDALARAGARAGALVRRDDDDAEAARALASPGGVIRRAAFAGALHAWPSTLATRGAPANTALAFVELPAKAPLAYAGASELRPLERAESVPSRILEQLALEAQIRELVDERAAKTTEHARRDELTKEIVALSTRLRTLLDELPRVRDDGLRAAPPLPRVAAVPRDADGDGVTDVLDHCPARPAAPPRAPDGCDHGLVEMETNHDYWLQPVQFAAGSAKVDAEQLAKIDFAAKAFHDPNLQLIGAFGHADRHEANAEVLSTARAEAIRRLLVERGVDADRVIAKGVGARWPIEEGDSAEVREKNRRASFAALIAYGRSTRSEYTKELPHLFIRGKLPANGSPYSGELADVTSELRRGDVDGALARADAWTRRTPADPLAWIGLGRALEAKRNAREAARAYGSLLDLAPLQRSRRQSASLRRASAGFLESLTKKHPPALGVALGAYRRALAEEDDESTSHRLYAWALAQHGDLAEAKAVLAAAAPKFPDLADLFRREAALMDGGNDPLFVATWEPTGNSGHADVDLVGYDDHLKPIHPKVDRDYGHGPEYLLWDPKPPHLEVELIESEPKQVVFGKVMMLWPGPTVVNLPFVLMNQGSRVAP